MQEKIQSFNIKGIKRDISQGISTSEYAFDAYNIRISARDNNTLMSVTNERGTEKALDLSGYLLGYIALNNKMVFFITTTNKSKPDYIYLVDLYDIASYTILYNGNLNFRVTNPIESISIFENEKIQRIYWVDGINQPRIINIATSEADRNNWKDHSFDFVKLVDANTKTLPVVNISKITTGNGTFPAGVIQYAFTFFDKYGSESNIFYQSELYYATTNGRGVSPEKNASCSFKIGISEIPTDRFDYIRIYSIFRSSYNAVPTVKVVTSLSIKNIQNTEFIDSNLTGYTIEPTNLLYLGGQSIIAGTIAQKDNTLFLGNIENITKNPDDTLKKRVKAAFQDRFTWEYKNLSKAFMKENQSYYPYGTRINSPSSALRTFKGGEYYRLGLQFQRHDGTWTEAVFLSDEQCELYCKRNSSTDYFQGVQGKLSAQIEGISDYMAVRPLVVYPDISNRTVLAQGVLNPTVFNLKDRMDNSPYAQASWFFRPNLMTTSSLAPEYRNLYPLPANIWPNAEIQNINQLTPSGESLKIIPKGYENNEEWSNGRSVNFTDSKDWIVLNNGSYYVDQNILTLNSPDIEFDDNVLNANFSNYKTRIIGAIPITGNSGNVDIIVENGTLMVNKNNSSISGFYFEKFGTPSLNLATRDALLAKAMWMDKSYEDKDTAVEDKTKLKKGFVVYPWHRNGSLNDTVEVEKDEVKRAALKHKVWLNYKYSEFNYNLKDLSKTLQLETKDLGIFHSDEVSMEKLKTYEEIQSDCVYYGNIDKVLPSYNRYPITYTTGLLKFSNRIPVNINSSQVSNASFIYADGGGSDTIGALKLYKNDLFYRFITPLKNKANDFKTYPISTLPQGNYSIQLEVSGSDDVNLTLGINVNNKSTIGILNTKDFNLVGNDIYDNSPLQNTLLYNSLNFHFDSNKTLAADLISMKYKSTPHAIMSLNGRVSSDTPNHNALACLPEIGDVSNNFLGSTKLPWMLGSKDTTISWKVTPNIPATDFLESPKCEAYLWLAEIYRDDILQPFGSTNEADIANNVWQVAGEPVMINDNSFTIIWNQGDTFYQRYDCIKTYPFTNADQNSVLEILSFMVETRINLDARYDRNRGNYNNLNISPLNYNLLNPVYNQNNGFFTYRSYDASQIRLTKFPSQITWSKTKTLGEEIDTWTNITLASSLDLDGDKGKLNSLKNFNNQLYAFQDFGISNVLYNENVQISSTQGMPIEIANSGKVLGKRYLSSVLGCDNKWSIIESSLGLYFIDTNTNGLFIINPQITPISDNKGFKQWFTSQNNNASWNPVTQKAFRLFYDNAHNDLYITNKETCLVYSEYLQEFTSFMSYEGVQGMFNSNDNFYSFKNNALWRNFKGQYNSFYDEKKPFYITYLANGQTPMEDKVFNSVQYKADFYNFDDEMVPLESFDRIDIWHDYQIGSLNYGERLIGQNPLKKKFNIWRAILPRGVNRQRIRNPWAYVRMGKFNPMDYRMQLHQLDVSYYI